MNITLDTKTNIRSKQQAIQPVWHEWKQVYYSWN